MLQTINISLPKPMYQEAQKILNKRGYASISELIRDALRGVLYPFLTVNGFTPEFEQKVLEAAKEPVENDIVLRSEKDIENYFRDLTLPKQRKKG